MPNLCRSRNVLMTAIGCWLLFATSACTPSTNGNEVPGNLQVPRQWDPEPLPEDVRSFLTQAESVNVYSITPKVFRERMKLEELRGTGERTKRGVYGSAAVPQTDFSRMLRLLDDSAGSIMDAKACFSPRHVVVAEKAEFQCILTICFQCSSMKWLLTSVNAEGTSYLRDNPPLAAWLDDLLRKASVTLSSSVDDKPVGD